MALGILSRIGGRLFRDESLVAGTGAGLTLSLIAAVLAGGWWQGIVQDERDARQRVEEVRAAAGTVGEAAGALMAAGELSSLRRVVVAAAHQHDLQSCSVILGDGGIVADAEPARINRHELPGAASKGVAEPVPMTEERSGNVYTLKRPVALPGGDYVTLSLSAAVSPESFRMGKGAAGVGVAGVFTLGAFLIIYHRLRIRLTGLGVVREALLASGSEHATASTLLLPDTLGPEASAWNRLIHEREQRRREQQLVRAGDQLAERRSSRGELDAAFDAISQGLLLIDEDLRVKHLNGAAAVYLNARRDALIGQPIDSVLTEPRVLQGIRDIVSGVSRRRTMVEMEREGDPAGGTLRFNLRPVRREDCAAAMIVIEDITQQRIAQESRGAFVAQATHELRAPLTNIRLYVETAIDEGNQDATVRAKCLNVINSEVRRLERIVSDMLSVAEIEAGSLKLSVGDVQLERLLNEVEEDYHAQAEAKNIRLRLDLPPKLPVLKGDRDKIALALHNLVGNAVKYTPEGGEVVIQAEVSEREVRVQVKDTGIGISEEDANHIFDRFYRAKDPRISEYVGSGLGLTLARDVARLHGGDISVQSELNKGSTFVLALPVLTEAA